VIGNRTASVSKNAEAVHMPDWEWDWPLMSKFEAICKEFGGEFDSSKRPFVCGFKDFDDFKAFSQWLNKQTPKKPIGLQSKYDYDNFPEDYVSVEFHVEKYAQFEKKLLVFKSRNMGDAQTINEGIQSELGGVRLEDTGWQDDLALTKTDEKDIIEKIQKPYLRQYATVETFFENDDDHWYAKADITVPIESHSVLSSVLEDADAATDELVSLVEHRFNERLYQEAKRLSDLHQHR